MININGTLAKEFSKGKEKMKVLTRNFLSNITPDIEFEKWLNYESELEKERYSYLNSLPTDQLSREEVKELEELQEQKEYALLFTKYAYHIETCSEKEYLFVYSYMIEHPLLTLMQKKLTKEELTLANNKLKKLLTTLSSQELYEYLTHYIIAYQDLSMSEAYILNRLSFIYSKNKQRKIQEEMKAHFDRNCTREKSLHYKINPKK